MLATTVCYKLSQLFIERSAGDGKYLDSQTAHLIQPIQPELFAQTMFKHRLFFYKSKMEVILTGCNEKGLRTG